MSGKKALPTGTDNAETRKPGKNPRKRKSNDSVGGDPGTAPTSSQQPEPSADTQQSTKSPFKTREAGTSSAEGSVSVEQNVVDPHALSASQEPNHPAKTRPSARSSSKDETAQPSTAEGSVGVKQKGAGEVPSPERRSCSIKAICPISHGRLWVAYRVSTDRHNVCLELKDATGTTLVQIKIRRCDKLFAIAGDHIISWSQLTTGIDLVRPDGTVMAYELPELEWPITSWARSSDLYQCVVNKKICRVTYHLEDINQVTSAGSFSLAFHVDSKDRSTKLICTEKETVFQSLPPNELLYTPSQRIFNFLPSDQLFHVSSKGTYFAFSYISKVDVHYKGHFSPVYSYPTEGSSSVVDARFCQIEEKERLLVTLEKDDKVHVVECENGHFVGYLPTEPVKLRSPRFLATDFDRHVWVSCAEGKVAMVDLVARTTCMFSV